MFCLILVKSVKGLELLIAKAKSTEYNVPALTEYSASTSTWYLYGHPTTIQWSLGLVNKREDAERLAYAIAQEYGYIVRDCTVPLHSY